ncbi:MAG: stalk domain-containing protein [Vulcanibacillus sp.]
MKNSFKHAFGVIFVAVILLGTSIIGGITVQAISGEVVSDIKLLSSEWITSGATLENWEARTVSGNVKINTVKIDLQNPYIKVGTVYGDDGKTGDKQRVINMAEDAGAVAAINGDFFTLTAEGAPFGVTIQDGQLINSPGYIAEKNAFMLDQNNIPTIERLDFDAVVTAQNGTTYQLFGLNKTQYSVGYRFAGGSSHINRLHMYDDKWNMENWVGDSLDNYTLVLVENGIVTKIQDNTMVESIPSGGYILLGNGTAAGFIKTHIHLYDRISVDFTLNTDSIIKTAIDGSTLLVDNGQKATITYEIKGNHARTAIGYSKDNRYLYLVTVEKSKDSVGMTLDELSTFLVLRDIWKAVNLDGGGSTTLVSRPLGQTNLIDITLPQYEVEREVPNGLAIFTTAPKGKLIAMDIILPKGVLLNETVPINNIKAYDEYYNPVVQNELNISWNNPTGVIYRDNTLTFEKFGVFNLKATSGSISRNYQVKVYERNDVDSIQIDGQPAIKIHEGSTFVPSVKMQFSDGTSRQVPNSSIDWQLLGVNESVASDGTITATKSSVGLLIASYQGFSTSIPIIVGVSDNNRLMDTFSNRGSYLLTGLTGTESSTFTIKDDVDRTVGELNYNFGLSEDIRIVYLQYGTIGKFVNGEPALISLDVKGDNSGHWLRTSIKDANDKTYYVDLAKNIDWVGWKTVTAQLPSDMAYPISIQSFYVVHLENQKDVTVNYGQLSFADLKVYDWNKQNIDDNKTALLFTVNKKEVQVNSASVVLDQAPVIINGRTYIPIRYVAELLGGEVSWLSAERKVQIIKDNKIFGLWIDEPYINENGLKEGLDAKPYITNGRTMVPLRALSESFGLYVTYDSSTKTISIK